MGEKIIEGGTGAVSWGEAAATMWQPIDTMPEGEHVLLYFPKGERGNGGIEAGTMYRTADGEWDCGAWTHGGPNSGADWDFRDDDRPTHWMPLPDPPA